MNDLLMNILGGAVELPSSPKAKAVQAGVDPASTLPEFTSLLGEFLAVDALPNQAPGCPELGSEATDQTQPELGSIGQNAASLCDFEVIAPEKLGIVSESRNQSSAIGSESAPSKPEELLLEGLLLMSPVPKSVQITTGMQSSMAITNPQQASESSVMDSLVGRDSFAMVDPVQEILSSSAANVMEIPVELVMTKDSAASDGVRLESSTEDSEADFGLLKASIQFPDASAGSLPMDSMPEAPAEAVLKIELEGKQLLIPVAIEQSQTAEQSMLIATDTAHFQLKTDLKGLIRPSATDSGMRQATPNAHIVVQQAVLIGVPEKIVRQLLEELDANSDEHQRFGSKGMAFRTSSEGSEPDAVANLKADQTDVDALPLDSKGRYAPRRIDPTRMSQSDEAAPDSRLQLKAEGIDKVQIRMSDDSTDRMMLLGKDTARLQVDSSNKITIARSSVPAEPVQFKIELPTAGAKIADVSSFKISLKPESLGTVKVSLVVVNDHLAARMSVETEAAKQAVESNLGALKESLIQQGVKVEEFSVNVSGHDLSRGQHGNRRTTIARKSKGEEFSLDPDKVESSVLLGARSTVTDNLAGSWNLLA
jgi:flagellar hook-length control protein FliK